MNEIKTQELRSIAPLFRVLGHPVRLQIVNLLNEQPRCVCEIADDLGLNKSVTSKHLSQLKQVGVVSMDKKGTQVMCSLAMPCVLTMLQCAIHPDSPKYAVSRPVKLCRKGCE
ncbi:MAG: metalloregulator ArsR/SmtB family transcription factor [Sphaerochaetaceae bacterium]|nr:metalloregulator ArsR/SmtB family transcription factor [Sphaerochaetaceae bacterium]